MCGPGSVVPVFELFDFLIFIRLFLACWIFVYFVHWVFIYLRVLSAVFSKSCPLCLVSLVAMFCFPFLCVCVSLQSVFLFSFSFFLFYFGIACSLCLISYYSVQLCSHLSPLSNTDVLRLHWVFCDFFCCWCAKSFIRCVLAANVFKVVNCEIFGNMCIFVLFTHNVQSALHLHKPVNIQAFVLLTSLLVNRLILEFGNLVILC